MSTAQRNRIAAGPRRLVRYVYLIEAWPEGAHLDHLDAFEQAPDSAVIAALTKEVEVYSGVITRERQQRVDAEQALERLQRAVRDVLDAAAPGPVGQLRMEVATS